MGEELSVTGVEERLHVVLQLVNDHLKFGEAKNGVLVAAAGALAVALLHVLLSPGETGVVVQLYVFILLLASCAASVVAIVSFLPQTRLPLVGKREDPSEADSLLFFGHIQKYTPEDYLRALTAAAGLEQGPHPAIHMQLAEQVVINARIAARKHTWFKWGAWMLLSGVVTPIGAYFIYERLHEEHERP